ncbi:MAG: hypothetical protein K0S44_1793 [Bacteroidetes bacterium]|jgi:hypothetical protein|nr:hypothetical protein [Bacteroidota bacterium]
MISIFKKIIFSVLISYFFSCSNPQKVSIPSSVLSKEKMAEVMVDVHLLEATLNVQVGSNDKLKTEGASSINVYNKHQVTKAQFDESFEFYTQNPEMLVEIYQLVLNDLSKLQAEVMTGK